MAGQLLTKNNLVAVLLCLTIAACARAAPELPATDFSTGRHDKTVAARLTAAERALTCKAVSSRQRKIASEAKVLEDAIKANRNYNQTAGYVSALVLPPVGLIVAKHNKAEKDRLDVLQGQKDRLILLARIKRC